MTELFCPACGQGYSEFDSHCPACGQPLPMPSLEAPTLVEGLSAAKAAGIPRDQLLGQQISHFRVQRVLGRGGMGIVYKAVDIELGRVVALKFLAHTSRNSRDETRFRREAQATAALDHPNIGTIYEVGDHDGRRFIAMAYYDGETLAARLAREPESKLATPAAAFFAGQLAAALEAAHAAGVVHRDLKPENVMITHNGRVKLLDFGLAKWANAPTVTEQGVVVGTAAYMAPEQLRGSDSGAAGDLWAFGVVLYQMLAGERPFGGERKGMVHSILFEDPPPLRQLRPDVPEALDRIVTRCLSKAPGERPDAPAILAELKAAGLWESASSGATATAPPVRTRRHWLRQAVAALLLLAAGTATYLLTRRPEPPVYVAVLKPEVTGSMLPDDVAQVQVNLQAALLRAVAALNGLAALDTAQVNAVHGLPAAIARAVAAGEVVASQADCAGDLCQVSLRRLDGSDGRVLWSAALRLPPSDPHLFDNAVAASLRQGYAGRELRVRRIELEIEPQDYEAFLSLRRRLDEPGALAGMLAGLEELRQRAPSFLEIYVLEARAARKLYSDTGEKRYLDLGLARSREALAMAPDDPRPLDTLFRLNLLAGRLDDAEAIIERMKEIDPAGSLLRRGQLAERRDRPEEALKLMAEAARLQPSWQTLLTVANAEYRLGRLDDARRHLEELLDRSPGNVDGLLALAQIELLRAPDRAVALFSEAARRDPGPKSLGNLGAALLLLRRYDAAERSLRQALELQPDDPSATLNLADCLLLNGQEVDARALYSRVVSIVDRRATPGDWQLLSVKAQALAHLGEAGKAVEVIQEALRLTPDNAQLAYEAAVVFVLVDDRGSALFHARRAASRGVNAYSFALPFFDPLRGEPEFQALRGPEDR